MPFKKTLYVPWYRVCEQVLGQNLIKHAETDAEIIKWVSREEWMILPLPDENDPEDAKTRGFPNIYFSLLEGNTIDIGLVCNTIDCVEKMENLMLPHSTPQKEAILRQMRQLSPDFRTLVSAKFKDHFASTPRHEKRYDIQTNGINDESLAALFHIAHAIRERGKEIPALHSPNYPSQAPVLDLATVRIEQNEELFRKKIEELKPLFQTCLNVRTKTEFEREEASRPRVRIVEYKCSRCGVNYTEDEYKSNHRFCPKDGMRINVSVRYE